MPVQYKLLDQFKEKILYTVFPRGVNVTDTKEIQKKFPSKHPAVFFEKQLHGIEFHIVKNPDENPGGGDVLITQANQIPLVVRIADCASVLLYDPVQKIIANIHAGWRGVAARVISHTIKTLADRFHIKPTDIIACISPMIGSCCCVFSDPKNELPKFMHTYINEENGVDLWAAVEGQLKEAGVSKEKIENPRICTFCNPEEYDSFRRDGKSCGRFGTAIMLK